MTATKEFHKTLYSDKKVYCHTCGNNELETKHTDDNFKWYCPKCKNLWGGARSITIQGKEFRK